MEVLYHHFYNVPLIDPNNPDTIAKQAEAARLMGEETARNSIDIFPEATAVLGLLKERGVKIGIITASAQNLLDADSKVGEILNICDYIQPTSLGVPHKPNPHVFDLAFERFLTPAGILREHVWYIGDAPHKDGAAAYRAKLGGFLGVATGLFSIADHHANGFDAVASIAQAPEYLGIK
jgi:phosphoglycolate phosphatase-like HAD superfamily hydrolase